MKNTRKFAAFVASILAVACMAAPMATSFSADAEGSITISNEASGHTYEAYQIFDGTLSTDGVLSNIQWGTGINADETETLMTELKTITEFASCTDAASVAEVLSSATENVDALTQKFASVVGKHLSATKTDSTFADSVYTISGVDDGYYLVKDKDDTLDEENDAKTRYIIEVLGNKTSITPKSDFPTVEKKVKEDDKAVTDKPTYENTTGQWNDVADYCIGEAVPFKLYGTIPSTINDYSKYKYVFHDTLAAQFNAPASENITITIINGDNSATIDINGEGETDTKKANVTVENNNITVTFNDIKAAAKAKNITLDENTIVTVEYSAVLNSNAVIGLDGQENKVYLTYSNNPNWVGTGDTDTPDDKGKTPEDKVIVFTYELDTTKVDGTDNNKKLQGAKFKLLNSDQSKEAVVDPNGKFVKWVIPNETESGTELVSAESTGLIKVAGLDDGTYYLKETEAPASYNLLSEPVEVVIEAATVNDQAWIATESASDALTALAVKTKNKAADSDYTNGTADASTGIASITIANKKGSSLPSTGGIGTTIFYVAGGALVVGAGVLLVSKKRMSNK